MQSFDMVKTYLFVLLMSLAVSRVQSAGDLPVLETLYEYEEYAANNAHPEAYSYLAAVGTHGFTYKNNEAALQRIRLRPKSMIPVGNFHPSLTVLGTQVSMPIGFCPVASQDLFHSEGEKASVRAAESANVIHILSLWSSTLLEDVAAAAPNAIRWQQVQISAPRDHIVNVVQRAETSGCKAIVLTIDAGTRRIRYNANYPSLNFTYPNLQLPFNRDSNQSWEDVAWLVNLTSLPVVIKGLLDGRQVRDAKDAGVKAIIVSNHGGRQLDGAPASIEVLAEIVDAVKEEGGDMEVYLDSGIRQGLDVFRALAIGAKMVFIGRPQVWGLIYNGTEGALNVLDNLNKEFVSTAQLSGVPAMADITRDTIVNPFPGLGPAETADASSFSSMQQVVCWYKLFIIWQTRFVFAY